MPSGSMFESHAPPSCVHALRLSDRLAVSARLDIATGGGVTNSLHSLFINMDVRAEAPLAEREGGSFSFGSQSNLPGTGLDFGDAGTSVSPTRFDSS